ncbi:hypothetical protein [Rhizobium rhizophilum]|uniref:Uncharacterized protein n=1 Tax=Rhizobium rhizophilum TaxID=1850373 RepID=A0ABY2QT35_9HYPH|nr:hypothetical protein [Rhizobium rhizophilum]THV13753.1 hypothetical protein E9677_12660 [Rhizobium rhizophilum]
MRALTLPAITRTDDVSLQRRMHAVEGSISLDDFEPTRHEPRDPYDWSLARPGSEYHIEPVIQHPPPDLDTHLAYARTPLSIRLAASRPTRTEHARATMIGFAAATFLAALAILTITAAAIRLPAIEQQLADAARV